VNELSQAALLGIDLNELENERPEHPRQVVAGIRHRRRAREYWQARKLESLVETYTLENYGEAEVR